MSVAVASPLESKVGLQNYFELFGIPESFKIDMAALDAAYLLIQQQVHPDKHVVADDAQKRASLQMATYANTAYQTLRNPIKRGFYLCEIEGLDAALETNTSMPKDFLMQQMEWREELDEAGEDSVKIERLFAQVVSTKDAYLKQIADLIDVQKNKEAALEKLRATLFMNRFQDELDQVIGDLL